MLPGRLVQSQCEFCGYCCCIEETIERGKVTARYISIPVGAEKLLGMHHAPVTSHRQGRGVRNEKGGK